MDPLSSDVPSAKLLWPRIFNHCYVWSANARQATTTPGNPCEGESWHKRLVMCNSASKVARKVDV